MIYGYVHTAMKNTFQLAEKFDHTLCSHGTVQYFCTVHIEQLRWFRVNRATKKTNFQPAENWFSAMWT